MSIGPAFKILVGQHGDDFLVDPISVAPGNLALHAIYPETGSFVDDTRADIGREVTGYDPPQPQFLEPFCNNGFSHFRAQTPSP